MEGAEILSREQLKKVVGGDGGSNRTGDNCHTITGACTTGASCISYMGTGPGGEIVEIVGRCSNGFGLCMCV